MIYKAIRYRSIQHLQFILAAGLLLGIIFSAWGSGIGRAATTITVNSFEDKINTDGSCTLREAIIAANKDAATSGGTNECPAGSGPDIIVLPAGTYTLTRTDNGKEDSSSTGDLDITSDITFQSEGGKVVIDAIPGFKDRIFHILAGTSTFENLTIQAGNPAGDGGGFYNKASLILLNSTVSGNTATGNGGAIFNAGSLTLTNVTLSGNRAGLSGGGLFHSTGSSNLNNITVSANTADNDANGTGDGGGIYRQSGSLNGTVSLANTLIGGNSDGSAASKQQPDCSGSLTSLGYNLVQNGAGCTLSSAAGDRTGLDPKLDPLGDYGGLTPTHRLQNDSPAIDKGNPAPPGSQGSACAPTDQRGVTRPQGATCDIGAYEAEDPLQSGPTFSVIAVVGSNEDRDDGACTFSHCSLREAIQAANARPNTADLEIHFNLSGGNTIQVSYPLPEITSPVVIDGTTQPSGTLILDGSGAGPNVNGLTINGGGSTLKGLTIGEFSCNGILLASSGNTIQGNTIIQNGCDGIRVASGENNRLTENLISANGLLGIDLGGDGPTANDSGDSDGGANNLQNYPVLFGADPFAESEKTVITWLLNGSANTTYELEFFSNQTCDASGFGEAEAFLASASVTTDSNGDAYEQTRLASLPVDSFVNATATDPAGNTSELSACQRVDARNDSWPAALTLNLPQNGSPAVANQYLDQQGQSRWYKFEIQPNSRLIITLTNLPANYDLTLYKDIKQAYSEITGNQDLLRLGAEFAADAFNADSFSSDAFNADAFSPQAFSPQAFSPQAFSPQAFSPQAFSPQAFSPQAFSPEAFLADAYAPQAFSPQAFSPQAFSPQAFSPQAFSPQAFSSAQTRSLIGVSAFDSTAGEGLIVNTWDNSGDFYVRVRGRNGAFDPTQKYHLEVAQIQGDCASVNTNLPGTSLAGESGGFHTLILTDFSRLPGSTEEKTTLQAKLVNFAGLTEVGGVVVDVGNDTRVAAANAEADRGDNYQCPFAKNQVAYAIKNVVDNYRANNPLEYVVIIGGDEVVPFFRHADQAMLANEKNYAPPVLDNTASQASLKLGYLLSQDRYGTNLEISHKDESFPLPDLAVGRLVETADDASRMLDAYMNPKLDGSFRDGVLTPASGLVTGYDFLVDNAEAVRDDLATGLGSSSAVDSLITPAHLSPEDPSDQVWTADDLRSKLFGTRHDLIYLAGHFSASGALAADFSTSVESSELLNLPNNLLENALIYSAGCHSGYNIVDPHGVPFVTREPDWAQAANSQGITLIAGTGYQYGDTDFIEYSERLYLEFTRQLRSGSGAVPIGKALVEAKQKYLADTPQLRGIHEKSLLEATLFGLPMYSVNMPGQRYTPDGGDTLPISRQDYPENPRNPGNLLGLQFSDVTITPSLNRFDVPLKNVDDNTTVTATYLKGKNGVITNPVEPVLPAEVYNASQANTVLRGVGFREGDYTDLSNILPLIGAATTEVRGVHSPFVTEFFYPVRLWSVNYLDALADGPTRLVVTPAHFRLDNPTAERGTLRQFNKLKLRLFYSNYGTGPEDETGPALSAAPSIVQVTGTPAGDAVDFQMRVVGNPAAGIQEVWVTYTSINKLDPLYGKWQSLNLTQDASDSTLWQGNLPLPDGSIPDDVRYVVQAVNGVGLVAFDTNQGAYHIPRFEEPPTVPTEITLISPETTGPYGTQVEFTAELTVAGGEVLPGQFLTFSLGPQSRRVLTGADGRASASLSLLGIPDPDPYQVKVTFPGTAEYIASKAESEFTITKQSTSVKLEPNQATATQHQDTGITATVTDATGRRLVEKTVYFVVAGDNGATSKAAITDYIGRAALGSPALPSGSYTVTAYFGGENIPLRTNGTVSNVTQVDERYTPSSASGTLTLLPANNDPVCSSANAQTSPPVYLGDMAIAWPPNSQLVPVTVVGLSDPDGDPVTYAFTGIFQDERVGRGPASPDGFIDVNDSSKAQVRAERDQSADGRMYHLQFTASDGMGGTCSSEVLVGVPSDQGGMQVPIDSGPPYYVSTEPG